MIRVTILLIALTASALAVHVPTAFGSCQTGAATLGDHYDKAEAVFIGRAIEVTPVRVTARGYAEPYELTEFQTQFEVIETFKGTSAKSLLTRTEYGRGDCLYEFESGKEYVVFAYREARDGSLRVRLGGPTAKLADAGAALVYCRRVLATGKGPSLIGTIVAMTTWEENDDPGNQRRPLPGVTVSVEVEGVWRETETDINGVYFFEGLSAATYPLRLGLPEGYRLQDTYSKTYGMRIPQVDGVFSIEIKAAEHAVAYFEVTNYGTVSGRLVDNAGAPIAGAELELMPKVRDARLEVATQYLRLGTNERGEFRSDTLPDGEFVLVVRPSYVDAYEGMTPRFEYPAQSGTSGTERKLIAVRLGHNTDVGVVRAPMPFASVPLDILVVRSFERPGYYGHGLTCTTVDGSEAATYFSVRKDGRVRIHLRAGLRYRIEIADQDEDVEPPNPIEVEAKPGLAPIQFELRLKEPSGSDEPE